MDAGTPDAGAPDSGPVDAGTPDAGPPPSCTLAATPDLADFGLLKAGQTARLGISFKNQGNGTCYVQLPYLATGTDPSLTADSLAAFTLQPAASKTGRL